MRDTKRQSQVNAEIQQIAGQALIELEFPGDCLVTITRVSVAPDLKRATIYLSVIPEHCWNGVKNVLKKEGREIQERVAHEMSMHTSPKLSFVLDDLELQARKMEGLLDEVAKKE